MPITSSAENAHTLAPGAALLGRILAAAGEAELCEAIAALAVECAAAASAMVWLAGGQADGGALAELRGIDARPVTVDGQPYLAVPLCVDGSLIMGALCVTPAEPRPGAGPALMMIAACGALQLARLRERAALQDEADRLRAQLKSQDTIAAHQAGERSMLRTLIDNMPDHIYAKDRSGRFIIGNTAAAMDILGEPSPQVLIGKSDLDFYPIEYGQRFFTDEQQIIHSGQPIIDQLEENINQQGVRRWFSTTKFPFHDADGVPIGIVGISRDVTARVDAEEAVRLRNGAIELSQDGIVITCVGQPGNPILSVNPAFERITGLNLQDARELGIDALLVDALDPHAGAPLRAAMQAQQEGNAVLRSVRKDGTEFWNEVRLAVIRAPNGHATHFVCTMTDVTNARQAEEQLALLASHDVLTGLPNRRMLMQRLTQAIGLSQRSGLPLAVAFIDLDRLKEINDTYGHDAGDLLIRTVAERMAGSIRKADTVARLGGDEFVLVSLHAVSADQPDGQAHARELLTKIKELATQPLDFNGVTIGISCSIGVSMYPQDGEDADTLLKHADEAMYVAKRSGRGRIVFHGGPQ